MTQKKTQEAPEKSNLKLGRNLDGTFTKGHTISVGNNGGRPTEDLSVRSQVKLRIQKNPQLLQKAIDGMFDILANPEDPRWPKVYETMIKLNGNFDPDETKLTGDMNFTQQRPYEGMTKEQILSALKKGKPNATKPTGK